MNENNAIYYASPFGDAGMWFKKIPPNASLNGKVSFSVDNPSQKLWLVFFDKIALQNKGFHFGLAVDILKLLDVLNHSSDLAAVILAVYKIARNTSFEIHGFSDIDDLSHLVLMKINPRGFREFL